MPEGTITFQPSRYHLQRHRVYLVNTLTADSVINNQASFAKDTQMFGYRRAALPKISCQCTGIRGTGAKAIEDLTRRVGSAIAETRRYCLERDACNM